MGDGSPDIGEVLAVQAEAERIVEQFYQENADIVGAEDIDRARGDFELFLHLIDRTIEKRRKMEAGQE
ncbi:MAG: hypothetical protein PHG91_02875 [Syntrophales bacterium]|jgi:hypothetical protein|nr:hypothetical protein [Syntrophales bacterium]MDD5232317.1 hypothetical protein [Syntrophales bacterium]MDD5533482.1 hypothetical protein [Syntrophales bacterium]